MKTKPTLLPLASLLLLGCLAMAPAPVRKLMADKKKSTVTYTMHHPLHTWDGVSHDVNSALMYNDDTKAIQSVAVAIKVASFDSQDANRDSHALEVLDGIGYPNVTFVGQTVRQNADGTITALGKLTFHGITKPYELTCTRKDDGRELTLSGNFDVNMTDFNVEQPSLLGMKTDDLIKLTFTAFFNL